ncbi:MAG TPA: proton-conducting transporter membrane subunit [Caldilineaceae bacterium]|nr:proton-conducting transporter membrane subunit [Caldilineaceae bacterium]
MSIFAFHLALLALASPLLWIIRPHRLSFAGWIAALPPAIVTGWQLLQLPAIAQGQTLAAEVVWSPALGLVLSFRLDGLSLFFGLIITGIGTCIALYTAYYLEGNPRLGYFYSLLFLFMASMLGLVWADNLLALFVFWEGTSITSFLLISFNHEDAGAERGASTALVVTGLGALAMLAGLVLLAQSVGSYSISTIVNTANLSETPYYTAALLLILLGAFTKSAQFPFHFWLPGAMAAPTPASAYLHSATMVKAGIYLLARLHPALHESALWFWALLLAGSITMILGAISTFRHSDLKAILANATLSQLGMLVMLLAFHSEYAYLAVIVGVLAHALYKGPLFMLAGIVDHAMETRDIHRLANLRTIMPAATVAATLASLSMAGFPPLFGFLAKETLLETFHHFAEYDNATLGYIGMGVGALGGALFVGYSLTFLWEPFFRREATVNPAHLHHAPSFWFVLPALLLVVIGTIIPLVLPWVEKGLLIAPAGSIAGEALDAHLALWHGFTPVFLTSLGAIALGLLIFWQRTQLRMLFAFAPTWLNGQQMYEWCYRQSYAFARLVTKFVQGGRLEGQISITLLCTVMAVGYALVVQRGFGELQIDWSNTPEVQEIVIALLAIVAAIVTVRAERRLSAIISIGVVGVVVTLAFAFFGAPDLALTQLLIEVLTVVLLILVFHRIPPRDHPKAPRLLRIRNLVMAVAVGFTGFGLSLVAVGQPYVRSISDYFSLNSVPAAHGANIVNVILVDFRGFDTMGEISVLAIAALGGYALLRASRMRRLPQSGLPAQPSQSKGKQQDA